MVADGHIGTEENTTDVVEQSVPDVTEESTEVVETAEASGDVTPEVPEYTPNMKYTVHDEEREFDDWAKPLVVDKASEDQFRQIHEKVYGIDHIKQDRDSLRERVSMMQESVEKYNTISQNIQSLNEYAQAGNYDAFFQTLGVPESEIMKWAANRIRYTEMSPEERMQYDRSVDNQRQAVLSRQQTQTMQQQIDQLQYERTLLHFDQFLSRPEIKEVSQRFDQRLGRQGAFRQAVFERGSYYAAVHKKEVPIEEVADEIIRMSGLHEVNTQASVAGAGQAPVLPGTSQVPPHVAAATAAKKPVIPNVEGSGLSPVKSKVSSLKDLSDLRRTRFGS